MEIEADDSDLTLTLTLSPPHLPFRPEDRGIRLVHLLLTCATHAASSNLPLADASLRLISGLSSPSGDSLQRLSSRLASSLSSRLLRLRFPGLLSSLLPTNTHLSTHHRAYHLSFARSLPYLPFTHSFTRRALLLSLADERFVHLLDLRAAHSSSDLYSPLLRALSRRPFPPQVTLTCVSPDPHVLSSLSSLLSKEANSLHLPFRFHPVNSSSTHLNLNSLKVKPGEALAVVSVLALHELLDEDNGGNRVDCVLKELKAAAPKVVVVAEKEGGNNSGGVLERFVEALYYYGAVFDSVEAAAKGGMMSGGEEREGVEAVVGEEVEKVVGREGRHESGERWVERMGRGGFRKGRREWWEAAAEEGRRVVDGWPAKGGGGYGVVVQWGCLMICWHGRPLYAVSLWES